MASKSKTKPLILSALSALSDSDSDSNSESYSTTTKTAAPRPRTTLITYRLPSEIEPNPRNNRFGMYKEEDLLDLLDDLDAGVGIETPLLTRKLAGTQDAVEVVTGSRRLAAVKLWNSRHAPSEAYRLPIITAIMNDEDAAAANIRENVKRRTLTAMDRAVGIRNQRNMGRTDTDICKMFCCSPATLAQSVKLLQLDRRTQERVGAKESGKDIPADAALVLAEMDAESRGNIITQHDLDKTKFTKSSVLKTGRLCGGVGDGTEDKASGRKAKRHSRTLKELTDYIEDMIFAQSLSEIGQQMLKGWKGMIEGKLSDDEMNKLLGELFAPAVANT